MRRKLSILPINEFEYFEDNVFESFDNDKFEISNSVINNDENVFPDVTDLKVRFLNNIYSYDCEDNNEENIVLSTLLSADKNCIIDMFLDKADKKDLNFFQKFIECFVFTEKEYDSDIVHFLVRYCINSDNIFLQRDGINLIALFKDYDKSLTSSYENTKFSHKYLSELFKKTIKENESFC